MHWDTYRFARANARPTTALSRRSVWVVGASAVVAVLAAGTALSAWPAGSHGNVAESSGAHRAVAQSAHVHEPAPDQLLPDLDQEVPAELQVRADRAGTYWFGFRSAVRNVGVGPLIVEGSRPNASAEEMHVDQEVERIGKEPLVIPDVGRMQYAVSPDHSHFHYMGFERYELQVSELRSENGDVVARDRKTGFCLGDRYRTDTRNLPAAPPAPVFRGNCGKSQPDLLSMRVGISVGYGDDYSAFLEGQDLSLEGLPDGHYVLVHRVNTDRRLHELSYANNAASVLVDLQWHRGVPSVRVLAKCPDSDRCDR